jgi:hypothetical protein
LKDLPAFARFLQQERIDHVFWFADRIQRLIALYFEQCGGWDIRLNEGFLYMRRVLDEPVRGAAGQNPPVPREP